MTSNSEDTGTAVIGGRPGVGFAYVNPTGSDQGLPPKAVRRSAPAPQTAAVPSEPLPMSGVAQAFVGREIGRLKAEASRLERDITRAPFGATGVVVPYLLERRKELASVRDSVLADIAALEGMTDLEVRQWAYDRGAR